MVNELIYVILKTVFKIAFKLLYRVESYGKENVPQEGGVIVAANHMSNADPPLMACFMDRPVSYMAKEELFANPIFGWAIKKCHAFPVKRGASDRAAVQTALTVLKEQRVLGMFPEGQRSKTGKIGEAKQGVVLIASMARVPIVPVAISGTDKLGRGRRFPKLKIMYGKPLKFAGDRKNPADIDKFLQLIMGQITDMKQQLEKNN